MRYALSTLLRVGTAALLLASCGGDGGSPPPPQSSNPPSESGPPNFANAGFQAYIQASNTKPGDLSSFPPTRGIGLFASSLALSGDTLAVGAPGERSCATGIDGDQADIGCQNAGAVYVFARVGSVWTPQAYIKASNTSPNLRAGFGITVALEGDMLAVGAPGESSCATGINGDQSNTGCGSSGAVYVFIRSGSVWSQQAYVKSSNSEASDQFGSSLSLAGQTLVVGAPFEKSCAMGINGDQTNNSCAEAGAVYVFASMGGTWRQQAYVKASNTGAGDRFGSRVILNNDTLAVGAPLEGSCATGVGGDQANNGCSGAGAVYTFSRIGDTWSQQSYVKASNTGAGDGFGSVVTLLNDTMAVGAPAEASCATDVDGDQANNACLEAGAVYVFVRTDGNWRQQAYVKAPRMASSQFGFSAALGNSTLAIGEPGESNCGTGINNPAPNSPPCIRAGAVHVFAPTQGSWAKQAYVKATNTRVTQPRFNPTDEFGFSVALDGRTLAVGADREASCATGVNGDQSNSLCFGAGAAYVYLAP